MLDLEEIICSRVICDECWRHIWEFHNFQETILHAQRQHGLIKVETATEGDFYTIKEIFPGENEASIRVEEAMNSNADVKPLIKSEPAISCSDDEEISSEEDGNYEEEITEDLPKCSSIYIKDEESQTDSICLKERVSGQTNNICVKEEESVILPQCSSSKKKIKLQRCRQQSDSLSENSYECGSSTDDEELQHKRTPGKPRKKPELPVLQTVEELDAFIAKWRPKLDCVLCPEGRNPFGNFSLLLQHFLEQHPKENCHIMCCGRKFYHRHEIEKHIHFHNGATSVKCEPCCKIYASRQLYLRHMKLAHSGLPKPDAPFKCSKCGKTFWRKYTLTRHINTDCESDRKEREARRQHKCHLCEKSYLNKKDLSKHLKWHETGTTKKPHKCTICSKAFVNSRGVREHMASHTGEPVAYCPYCPRTYNSRVAYTRHFKKDHAKEWEEQQRQKTEKSYKCSLCDKVLQNEQHFNEHMGDHTGVPKVQCSHCTKVYFHRTNLQSHWKKDHPHVWEQWQQERSNKLRKTEQIINCSLCAKQFEEVSDLNVHLKEMHSKEQMQQQQQSTEVKNEIE